MESAVLAVEDKAVIERKASARSLNLESLYDVYGREVMGYLRALTRNEAHAEDALSETFIRMAKKGDTLFNIGNVKGYLFKTARNEAFRIIENEKRLKSKEETAGSEKPLIMAEDAGDENAEDIASLEKALRQLPVKQREIVFLKCVEGFTFDEIAKLVNVSRDTAASRYRYGIEKLRTLMGAEK